jgi:hypothetical protein
MSNLKANAKTNPRTNSVGVRTKWFSKSKTKRARPNSRLCPYLYPEYQIQPASGSIGRDNRTTPESVSCGVFRGLALLDSDFDGDQWLLGAWLGRRGIEFPVEPVGAEEFDRMLSANGPVAAAKVVDRAIEIASPADTFRMLGMEGQFRFAARFVTATHG